MLLPGNPPMSPCVRLLFLVTRLSGAEDQTRGFTSPSRGGFAFVQEEGPGKKTTSTLLTTSDGY